jgi:phosphoglycerate dehydrogenase-like enzyme
MTNVLLAIHPRVRSMVLAPGALDIDGATIMTGADDLRTTGWPADPSIEAVMTGWGTPPITEEVLDLYPALRAILHVGGSIRQVIEGDPWSRGIVVTSAADVNNESVADFVAAQTLLALKGSHRAAASMRATGRLPGPAAGPGSVGQRIGLVSYGSVARKVRSRLRDLDAHVSAWDPFVDAPTWEAEEVEPAATLLDLFERSIVLSIHAPLIPGETEGMISRELLSALPHGATLINTARGALIDENGMTDVLRVRTDLFAILDVTWPEPPAPGSPLYDLPNVLLTGHTAGSVGTENLRMGWATAAALKSVLRGDTPDGLVTAELARIRA